MAHFQYQIKTEPVSLNLETVTQDRWHQGWSQAPDTRNILRGNFIAQQGKAFPSDSNLMTKPEIVTESRWHFAWGLPVWPLKGLSVKLQPFTAFTLTPTIETPVISKFNYPWSNPTWRLPGLAVTNQRANFLTEAAPFGEFIFTSDWFKEFQNPTWPLSLHYVPVAEQPYLVEIIPLFLTSSSWFNPFSEPVRRRWRIGVSLLLTRENSRRELS